MLGYFYGIDLMYIVLVLPAIIFSVIAQAKVKSSYKKYGKVLSCRGLTGAMAAQMILRQHGLNLPVNCIAGELTDHYDPKANVINLSSGVYNGTSVASIGIAAHEVGHAIQYAENYGPVRLRMAIIPVTQVASKLAFPLVIAGLILSSFSAFWIDLAYVGIIAFGLAVFFQLVTLPVEFNASSRAVSNINEMGILTEDELRGTKKVLTAAALTYVASLAVSLMQLLRLIIMVSGSDRRR